MYVVFEVDKEKTRQSDKALKDDLLSRQSITVRDAKSIDIDKDVQYVVVDGSEESIAKAKELYTEIGKPLADDEAKSVYDKIKAQDADAASGVGMIFGD